MTDLVDKYDYPDKLRSRAPNVPKRWGPEIHEDRNNRRNTDYDFPKGWGIFSPDQKAHWFLRERVFRQACRQKTTFGDRWRAFKEEQERLDTDKYRYDT